MPAKSRYFLDDKILKTSCDFEQIPEEAYPTPKALDRTGNQRFWNPN